MRFRVYQDGRFASGAVAAGRTLTVYDDSAMATESTLYTSATGATEEDNPYTVPATGIIDFWTTTPRPYGLAQGDSTARPLRLVGSEHAISVRDFGALGDGTTDDSAAIQAAVDSCGTAGGRVLFPPGTYLLSSAAIQLPAASTGRLVLSGYGATVKLSSGSPRFLDFAYSADHDTFQHITVEGFEVDADNIGGRHHVIIGNYSTAFAASNPSGANYYPRLNYDDILLRDLRSYNVPGDQTLTNHRLNIYLLCWQAAPSEATQNYATNITIDNVTMDGGNYGICIGGVSGTGVHVGTNIYCDNVHITNCWHDTNVRYTGASSWTSANYHLGAAATGGVLRVRDCYGAGSGDVVVEVNAWRDALIEGVQGVDANNAAFLASNHNTAPAGQVITFRKCSYVRTTAGTTAYGGGFNIAGGDRTYGTLVYDNCSVYIDQAHYGSNDGIYWGFADSQYGQVDRFVVRNFEYRRTGYVSDAAGGTHRVTPILVRPGKKTTGRPTSIVIDGLRAYFEGTVTAGDTIYVTPLAVAPYAPEAQVSVRDVDVTVDLTDAGAGLVAGMCVGSDPGAAMALSDCAMSADISGATFKLGDDTAPHGIWVGPSTKFLPESISIRECDFSRLPSGASAITVSGTANQAKTTAAGNSYYAAPAPASITTKVTLNIDSVSTHATTPTVTTAAAHGMVAGDYAYISGITELPDGFYQVLTVPLTTTFTVSGTTTGTDTGTCQPAYTNRDYYDEDVVVTGGTVTNIQLSTNRGTTWTSTGLTAGIFRLRCADSICITNSSAPTTTKIPRP